MKNEEYEGTYADESSSIVSKEYGWNHGIGEVVTALTDAGLRIESFNEHDESPYNVLPNLADMLVRIGCILLFYLKGYKALMSFFN